MKQQQQTQQVMPRLIASYLECSMYALIEELPPDAQCESNAHVLMQATGDFFARLGMDADYVTEAITKSAELFVDRHENHYLNPLVLASDEARMRRALEDWSECVFDAEEAFIVGTIRSIGEQRAQNLDLDA